MFQPPSSPDASARPAPSSPPMSPGGSAILEFTTPRPPPSELDDRSPGTKLGPPSSPRVPASADAVEDKFLSVPAPGGGATQPSLVVTDLLHDVHGLRLSDLPPEMAAADIQLAPDGSFIDTSSASTAMELKKRLNQQPGASPAIHTITAFTNQHGKQMFRVGTRAAVSAPGASGVEAEERLLSQQPSAPRSPPQTPARPPAGMRRRSRLSLAQLHNFARAPTMSMFKSSHGHSSTSTGGSSSYSGVTSGGSSASGLPSPPLPSAHDAGPPLALALPATHRKLRKTRSIPDMLTANPANASPSRPTPAAKSRAASPDPRRHAPATSLSAGTGANGFTKRQHSHTVSGSDYASMPVPRLSTPVAEKSATGLHAPEIEPPPALPPQPIWDVFGEVMQSGSAPSQSQAGPQQSNSMSMGSSPFASPSSSFASSSLSFSVFAEQDGYASRSRAAVTNPFGSSVTFDAPVGQGLGEGQSGSESEDDDGVAESASDAGSRRGDDDEDGPEGTSPYLDVSPHPVLRVMQSFDSGLTARAGVHEYPATVGRGLKKNYSDILEDSESMHSTDRALPSPGADYALAGTPADANLLPPLNTASPLFDELGGDLMISLPQLLPGMVDPSAVASSSSGGAGLTSSEELTAPEESAEAPHKLGDIAPHPPLVEDKPESTRILPDAISTDRFAESLSYLGGAAPIPQVSVSVSADAPLTLSDATRAYTRYSTEVFDVMQKYRGLPMLDKLSPFSHDTAVVKLSLEADDSAAPRNDPRFVIWGEVSPEHKDEQSADVDGATDVESSAVSGGLARRKSGRRSRKTSGAAPDERARAASPSGMKDEPQKVKVMVAATIERWIAQLTSELNYDELLIFFLTYRTYITGLDLAHLLICRFHWALEPSSSTHDEMVRRIVRVRTFVAVRYWLVTFFHFDFVPNRELRVMFAGWLNTLKRDPILEKNKDAGNIVRKLTKVIKECKEAYLREGRPGRARRSTNAKPRQHFADASQLAQVLTDRSDGSDPFKKAVETLKKATAEEDSDVDLDFAADEENLSSEPAYQSLPFKTGSSDVGPSHATLPASPQSQPMLVGSASLATLQQQPHLAIMPNGVPQGRGIAYSPLGSSPLHTTQHQSAFSRAFVNTIGRLGKWKRVMNPRSLPAAPLPRSVLASASQAFVPKVSAFDLEIDDEDVAGGSAVIEHLKTIAPLPQTVTPPMVLVTPTDMESTSTLLERSAPSVNDSFDDESVSDTQVSHGSPVLHPVVEEDEIDLPDFPRRSESEQPHSLTPIPQSFETAPSYRSSLASSRFSYQSRDSAASPPPGLSPARRLRGPPAAAASAPRTSESSWRMDVVSIDDLELSDMSDYESEAPAAPPGLRKLPRRLPQRRDFEFVRPESVSSLGIKSHSSMASGRDSMASSTSSMGSMMGVTFGAIEQWQVNAIVDSLSDDDDEGDVEAALRRLEGQINHAQVKAKAHKVDGWVQQIRERMAAGDYGDEPARFPTSDDSDMEDDAPSPSANHSNGTADTSADLSQDQDSLKSPLANEVATPHADQTTHMITPPSNSPQKTGGDVDMRKNRPAGMTAEAATAIVTKAAAAPSTAEATIIKNPAVARVHRSFVLSIGTEQLAQHFAMIDKELFTAIKFEELLSEDPSSSPDEARVLDWAEFLRDRAAAKTNGQIGLKTSALVAVRARFNLVANFVASEVLLTHPSERGSLVTKFIRLAFKSWGMNNFSTLVAIMAGLQTEWVNQAMRRLWGRVGSYEERMLRDFRRFTTADGDFKHIREIVDALIENKPVDGTHTPSVVSGGLKDDIVGVGTEVKPPSGIPFIGIYLAQMRRCHDLPDLIDPTAPHEAVTVDPVTANFEPPAHPEVFAALMPLPASMQLEPLINVQKQRRIANVVKSLVAGQHLATRIQCPVERKTFQKCLRLKGLDHEMKLRALALYADYH